MDVDQKYRTLLGKVGFLANRQGMVDVARGIFDALQTSDPGKIGPVLGKAQVLMNEGKHAEAAQLIKDQALSIDADDVHAKAYLGLAYCLGGEKERAKEALEPVASADGIDEATALMAQELLDQMG